ERQDPTSLPQVRASPPPSILRVRTAVHDRLVAILWVLLRSRGRALRRSDVAGRYLAGLAARRRFLSNRLPLGRCLSPDLARTDARDDHAVLGPDRGIAAAEIAEFSPTTLTVLTRRTTRVALVTIAHNDLIELEKFRR